MDPKTALKYYREALKNGDADTASEIASDLRDWFRRGGFVPRGMTMAEKRKFGVRMVKKRANTSKSKKNPCSCRNPNFHYPRTARGRPKKTGIRWNLGYYGASDKFLGRESMTGSRSEAHARAKAKVGARHDGREIQRVVLTGPK